MENGTDEKYDSGEGFEARETAEGEIFKSRPIRNAHREDVYLRFAPTRKLVLITDQNGSPDEDWSVWLRPEVR